MKKELRTDILSLSHKLAEHIQLAKKHYDAEDIHVLRTSFKKIRALLRWQKAGKEIYQGFKEIYAVTGELRNIQVVQKIIETDTMMPVSFQNWLSFQMNSIKRKLDKTDYKKSVDSFYDSIKNINLFNKKNRSFFICRTIRIQAILSADPVTDDQLHEIRKMIKDMQYVMEWWKNRIGKTKELTKDLAIKTLEFLSKQIGSYNDKRVLLTLLTTYIQQETDPVVVNDINIERGKWQIRKISEKEKLVGILRYEFIHT